MNGVPQWNVVGKNSYYDLSNHRFSSKRRKILSHLFRSLPRVSCVSRFAIFPLHFKTINRKNRRETVNRRGFPELWTDQVFLNFLETRYVEAGTFLNIYYSVQFPVSPRPQSEEENDCPNVILRDSRLLRSEVSWFSVECSQTLYPFGF